MQMEDKIKVYLGVYSIKPAPGSRIVGKQAFHFRMRFLYFVVATISEPVAGL